MSRIGLTVYFMIGILNSHASNHENWPSDPDLKAIANPPSQHTAPHALRLNKTQRKGLQTIGSPYARRYLEAVQDTALQNRIWKMARIEPGVAQSPSDQLKHSNSMRGRKDKPVPPTIMPTPVARKLFDRPTVALLTLHALTLSREDMACNQQHSVARRLDFENLVYQRRLQSDREAFEIKLIQGLTRSQAAVKLRSHGSRATADAAKQLEEFIANHRGTMNRPELKDALKEFFTKQISPSFKHFTASIPQRIGFQTLNFFVNPFDIDLELKDARGRTNIERLHMGYNPVSINPNTNTLETFEYHHITQSVNSPILCLPYHLHTEKIHPFPCQKTELDPVDRSDFGFLKRQFNMALATYFKDLACTQVLYR